MSDKPAINTSERLFDLVRYMRAELHEADLISDEEYFWLCSESPMANSPKGGSPSRERLEEYDEMRERIETLERENAAMREAIKEAHASIEHLIDIASGGMRPANGPMIAIRNGHKTLTKIQPFLKP